MPTRPWRCCEREPVRRRSQLRGSAHYSDRVSSALNVGGYVVVAILVIVAMWASLDAARRPRWAWQAAGSRKWLWVAGMLVGTYFLFGLIFVLLYLGGLRKDLQEIQARPLSAPA